MRFAQIPLPFNSEELVPPGTLELVPPPARQAVTQSADKLWEGDLTGARKPEVTAVGGPKALIVLALSLSIRKKTMFGYGWGPLKKPSKELRFVAELGLGPR